MYVWLSLKLYNMCTCIPFQYEAYHFDIKVNVATFIGRRLKEVWCAGVLRSLPAYIVPHFPYIYHFNISIC